MNEDDKERYVRWQGYRIEQLSFSINLFIGLAVASIGFVISEIEKTACMDKHYVLLFLAFSLAVGIVATISRLVDFRYTVKKIESGNENLKRLIDCAGKITWISFGLQLSSYLIGAGILLFKCALS